MSEEHELPLTPEQKEILAQDCLYAKQLNAFAQLCHDDNHRWWHDLETGERLQLNDGERFMLIVSEVSEAMEGVRKDLLDEHLPQFKSVEVELADVLIRVFDYCGAHGLRVGEAFAAKRRYNKVRLDHTREARLAAGGKKF